MNAKLQLIAAGGILTALVTTASAIEGLPDNAPPPRLDPLPAADHLEDNAEPAVEAEADKAPVREGIPYMGLSTGPLPDLLASHLQIPAGEGVVVRGFGLNSPAEAAGIAEHDIITKIAGKPVRSHEELRKLTLTHRPGDEVDLDVIHEGKPVTRKVVLGVREDRPLPEAGNIQGLFEGLPAGQAERLREAIEAMRAGIPENFPDIDKLPEIPQVGEAIRQLNEQMAEMFKNGGLDIKPGDLGAKVESKVQSKVRFTDPEGTIEMQSIDENKELTVRGPNDEIIWSGPWDTEQDKAAAPEEVRRRVEGLNFDNHFKGKGLRFNLNLNRDLKPEPAE